MDRLCTYVPKFKTNEMLKLMVDLSKEKRKYMPNLGVNYYGVSFNFGRTSGHTEAIYNYVMTSNEPVCVIFFNDGNFYSKLPKQNQTTYISVRSIDRLVGIDTQGKVLIIDASGSISQKESDDLNMFLHLNSFKALVKVGEFISNISVI